MTEIVPPWLKAIQNGSLGEARAKAFLMDRFWILERSVDIEGADLIIQRRLTSKNLLDRTPPNLGFVQVKFFESEKTTHYIPRSYIIDNDGNLREDFFLLFHTGFEEKSKMFFLTTDIIAADFEIVGTSGIEKFRITGKKIIENTKYIVRSNSSTLSRIESRLELADFKKNRTFISWKLPNILYNDSAILPDYREEIENSWGNIPEEFQRIKKNALKAMKDIENVYLDLKEIAEEIDPIQAFSKIESLLHELGSSFYGRWGDNVMESLFDEEFYHTCKNHKEKVETLRNDGLLDAYISIKATLLENILNFLALHFPIDSNTVHSMVIHFSKDDFKLESVDHKMISIPEYFNIPAEINQFGHIEIPHKQYRGFKDMSDCVFEYYWLAGRVHVEEKYRNNLIEFYRKTVFGVHIDCLDKMYNLKYSIVSS